MHKGDTVPGLLSILFGGLFVAATVVNPQLTAVAQTSDGVPGAGFFPYLLGGAIILLGIVLLIRGIRQHGTVQYIQLDEEGKKNVKVLLLSLLGIIALLVFWRLTNQFIIGVPILCLYLNWLFERKWLFNILYAGIFSAFIYLVFTVGFSVQFVV